jgi:hypothetical protein
MLSATMNQCLRVSAYACGVPKIRNARPFKLFTFGSRQRRGGRFCEEFPFREKEWNKRCTHNMITLILLRRCGKGNVCNCALTTDVQSYWNHARSRRSSVYGSDYGLDDRVSILGSGAHLGSYPVGAEGYFVKNMWSYTSTPQYVFMVWCVIKHRNDFTFLGVWAWNLW